MKLFLTLVSLGAVIGLAACSRPAPSLASGTDSTHAATVAAAESASAQNPAAVYYTCAMHPWVRSDRPGACPVCGMALVKRLAHDAQKQADLEALEAVSLSPTQRVLANVSTVPATRGQLNQTVTAVGVVDYAETNQATVSARFSGRIEKLYVNYTGDVVRRGQPLFELHSPELVTAEQDYLLALATRDQQEGLLEAAHERLMVHFGLTGDQIAAIGKSRSLHSNATFYSPIHGTVVAKQIQEGQYVSEGMLLYQLADLSTVWAYIDVYEADLRSIKLGQPLTVTTESYPGETFSGRVTFISPSVDPQTRTVRIRTQFDNKNGKLKPQMYVQAQLAVSAGPGLVIPATAVLFTGKRNVVWVEVKPNTFEPRDVELGARTGQAYQVLRGLNEGDLVAATGGFMLESESELQQPMAGHQHGAPAAPGDAPQKTPPPEARSESGAGLPAGEAAVHTVKITVNGDFVPNVVHAKKGEHLRLLFFREKESGCVQQVVFKELGIRKDLDLLKDTPVDLTPADTGELEFTCGMGMVKGTVVVD